MSKQLKCDKCGAIVNVPSEVSYTQFPEGWLTVTTRHPEAPDSDQDYCGTQCAIDALIESKP